MFCWKVTLKTTPAFRNVGYTRGEPCARVELEDGNVYVIAATAEEAAAPFADVISLQKMGPAFLAQQAPERTDADLDAWHRDQHNPARAGTYEDPSAFIPGLGTVRPCRVCKCLVSGGPTICELCERKGAAPLRGGAVDPNLADQICWTGNPDSLRELAEGNKLREHLASYAHDAWSGWMKYMFGKCLGGEVACLDLRTRSPQPMTGIAVIPDGLVTRWKRQMNTQYSSLPEEEKKSDREEADKMLAIFEQHLGAAIDETAAAFVKHDKER